jgi:hypothetical protein
MAGEKGEKIVLRAEGEIGVFEWVLPDSIQEMFAECEEHATREPEEIQKILFIGKQRLIEDYHRMLMAYLHLLVGVLLCPVEESETIILNALTDASSKILQLMQQYKEETLH